MPRLSSLPAFPSLASAEPHVLEHFVGQAPLVRRLKVALELAVRTGARLPHILLAGSGGCGKNLLARILSREMGSPFHRMAACELASPADLLRLTRLGARDVFILEDVDGLCPQGQLELARALSVRRVAKPIEPPDFRDRRVPVRDLTLIATCEDGGGLLRPLQRLFRLRLDFDSYALEEIARIIAETAVRAGVRVSSAAVRVLTELSLSSPAAAAQLLESCWHQMIVEDAAQVSEEHVVSSFEVEGFSVVGADRLSENYLRCLRECGDDTDIDRIRQTLHWPDSVVSRIQSLLVGAGTISVDANRVRKAEAERGNRQEAPDSDWGLPF